MDLGLNGKKALVTGASRGIGLATVRSLLAEGAAVVGASRTISDELRETGVGVITVDLSTTDGPGRMVADAVERLGGLDVLVNNAGGGDDVLVAGLLDYDEDFWQRIFDLNFYSAVRACRAAIPALLETKGTIVNISSMGAKIPGAPGTPIPYATAKAALDAFSKALSEEYGPQGLSVKTCSPGPTRTSVWKADGYGGGVATRFGIEYDELIKNLPTASGMTIGRFISAEEVAAFITYLASPLAGAIAGSDHLIEGGAVKTV